MRDRRGYYLEQQGYHLLLTARQKIYTGSYDYSSYDRTVSENIQFI